jgi:hypothetical protein
MGHVFSVGDDRSHRGTTLLYLLVAGTGGVDVMERLGHGCVKRFHPRLCSPYAKQEFFERMHITTHIIGLAVLLASFTL